MILNDIEITERMESPLNLLSRLKSITGNSSSKHNSIPSLPPSASDVIEDLEEKLAYGSIKSKASGIMIAAMDELRLRMPEVQKPEQLAKIAAEMSKVVNAEVKDNNRDGLNKPQFILYAPQFNNENHYDTIYARE